MAHMQQSQAAPPGTAAQPARPGAPGAPPDHSAHGRSVAAWTAVSVVMLGALIMCIAVVIAVAWVFVLGAVVALVGAISGRVLSAMGFGVSGRPGH